MKIILSPAKKMIVDLDSLAPSGVPEYLNQAQEILNWLKGQSQRHLWAGIRICMNCGEAGYTEQSGTTVELL